MVLQRPSTRPSISVRTLRLETLTAASTSKWPVVVSVDNESMKASSSAHGVGALVGRNRVGPSLDSTLATVLTGPALAEHAHRLTATMTALTTS
ncbi:unannotated protein [freshwater metagenome]|uniref:Unannotated protein n=1 Tax=freshwater metagenome TaxID=449393 RepID=A0A6J7K934_9ZZZZ